MSRSAATGPFAPTVGSARVPAIALTTRSVTAIVLTSAVGVLAFTWPMLAPAGSELVAHAADAPLLFAVMVPALLAVTLSLVGEGAVGAKAIAMLGLLAAIASALRALGAGIAGLEPLWVVVVLGGYALGAGFGFVLGPVCIVASALLTGGVGPWLPFQMIGAAWVGFGAGLLGGLTGGPASPDPVSAGAPRPTRRRGARIWLLACYSALAALAYGWLLNLWFWPTLTGLPEGLSYVPGAGPMANLGHWIRFNLTTSMGYDVPRALLTGTCVVLLGPRILSSLHRVTRRAAFGVQPRFED